MTVIATSVLLVVPAQAQVGPLPTAPPHNPLPTAAPEPTIPDSTLPPGTTAPTTTTPPPPTAPPTTAAPATTVAPTTTTAAPTSTTSQSAAPSTTPAPATTTAPPKAAVAGPGSSTSSTTVPGPPPASLSEASVSSYLATLSKSGTNNSTQALLDALKPLQDYGVGLSDAIAAGFGDFPVGGLAYWRDDFHEPRTTPEPHEHQGNDVFTSFDTPVRAPADGVLTYSDELVGGKSAYVTLPDGTWYYLCHLDGYATNLRSGQPVRAGQVIGFAGDTGDAKGGPPHVHFEVHPKGGPAIDPKPILDQWLADALANVPNVLAVYKSGSSLRPLTAIGLARFLDQGMLSTGSRLETVGLDGPGGGLDTPEEIADALVSPLTPSVLRRS